MECPRCNSKLPDNMEFCGFCGIELQTGKERGVDRWIRFLELIISSNIQVQNDMTRKMIASLTLAIASLITLVSIFPFQSAHSWIIGILAVIGIVAGGGLAYFFAKNYGELNIINRAYNRIYSMILTGRLRTSKDILDEERTVFEKLKPELKYASNLDKFFSRLLGE